LSFYLHDSLSSRCVKARSPSGHSLLLGLARLDDGLLGAAFHLAELVLVDVRMMLGGIG